MLGHDRRFPREGKIKEPCQTASAGKEDGLCPLFDRFARTKDIENQRNDNKGWPEDQKQFQYEEPIFGPWTRHNIIVTTMP